MRGGGGSSNLYLIVLVIGIIENLKKNEKMKRTISKSVINRSLSDSINNYKNEITKNNYHQMKTKLLGVEIMDIQVSWIFIKNILIYRGIMYWGRNPGW